MPGQAWVYTRDSDGVWATNSPLELKTASAALDFGTTVALLDDVIAVRSDSRLRREYSREIFLSSKSLDFIFNILGWQATSR